MWLIYGCGLYTELYGIHNIAKKNIVKVASFSKIANVGMNEKYWDFVFCLGKNKIDFLEKIWVKEKVMVNKMPSIAKFSKKIKSQILQSLLKKIKFISTERLFN